MSDTYGFEASPFDLEPEYDGVDEELRRRGGRPPRRTPPGRPRPSGRRPQFSRPRPRPRPRPLPHPRRLAVRRPLYGRLRPRVLVTEPARVPAAGSERVRWAQDCLNHTLGLSLAVSGLMGTTARSALRDFQRREGLRPTGILGPDTERALRAACANRTSPLADADDEELGPLTATLKWIGKPTQARFFTIPEASEQRGGGVYILLGKPKHSTQATRSILKVGKTHSFQKRFGRHTTYRDRTPGTSGARRRVTDSFTDLRVYLARISGDVFADIQIEKAISRLLQRAGEMLPADYLKFTKTPVVGPVRIVNALPPQLIRYVKGSKQIASALDPTGTLTITRSGFPKWELSPSTAASGWGNEMGRRHPPGCDCPRCCDAASRGRAVADLGNAMRNAPPAGRWQRRGNAIRVFGA